MAGQERLFHNYFLVYEKLPWQGWSTADPNWQSQTRRLSALLAGVSRIFELIQDTHRPVIA